MTIFIVYTEYSVIEATSAILININLFAYLQLTIARHCHQNRQQQANDRLILLGAHKVNEEYTRDCLLPLV